MVDTLWLSILNASHVYCDAIPDQTLASEGSVESAMAPSPAQVVHLTLGVVVSAVLADEHRWCGTNVGCVGQAKKFTRPRWLDSSWKKFITWVLAKDVIVHGIVVLFLTFEGIRFAAQAFEI